MNAAMPRGRIEVLETGFAFIQPERGTDKIGFDQINKIAVYKADLFTVDLICCQITFNAIGGPANLTLDEEIPGFDQLMTHFQQLRGFDQDWYQKVVPHAFATNWTVGFQAAK
jgi:hypothetical protein